MTNLYRVISFLLFFTSLSFVYADSREDLFYSELSRRSAEVSTLRASFIQTKHVKLLNTKVVSNGKFQYKKGIDIRFDYASPKVMSIIMTNINLRISTPTKTTTYDFAKQRSLAELAVIMEACVSGKLKELPDKYKVIYKSSSNFHIVTITNLKRGADNPYTMIELHFCLEDYSLRELILYERSEDTTFYSFNNIVTNG
ncbi:MAG: outer membrane lipoprotein carrier protein LolA [Bacteroidales bacterium]|nr:outer membrane lipoprotein carrier protein LolA [Bacteroidales bacterium]